MHKFKVGQSVSYVVPDLFGAAERGTYEVTRLLPLSGEEFQYRIKSALKPFEQVARES